MPKPIEKIPLDESTRVLINMTNPEQVLFVDKINEIIDWINRQKDMKNV